MNNNESNLQQTFTDEKGVKSTVILESKNGKTKNISKGNYKLVENIKSDTNKYLVSKKTKGILTADIGVHSEGFAPIITLSSIIAISLLVVLYIIFKF